MDSPRKMPIAALLVGMLTVFLWAGIWSFSAAIGTPSGAAGLGMWATIVVLTAVSSGASFLVAYVAIRWFGVPWSAGLATLSLVLTAVIAGTEGWTFLLLTFFVLTFPALGSVSLLRRASENSRTATRFHGARIKLAAIAYLVILSAVLFATRPPSFTELHSRTYYGFGSEPDLDAIARAISSGEDVNLRASSYYWGGTALHFAAKRESVELIRMLIDAGADLTLRDDLGNTPLHEAAKYSESVGVVRELLDAGADINARSNTGATPLHSAASRPSYKANQAEIVTLLIEAGSDVNAKTNLGDTPLYRAANAKDWRVVSALLEAGADVNAFSDWSGETPIHMAAKYGGIKTIDALKEAGADLNALDKKGQTPLDLARARGRASEIIDVLRSGVSE